MHLVGERGGQGIVGGEHDRRTALAAELAQQAQHFLGALRVERSRGLVREHELGVGCERHRDQHALALPHGELLGAVLHALAEAQLLEQRLHDAPRLALVGEPQLQRGVLDRARPGNQVVGLADDPQIAQAVLVALLGGHRGHLAAAHPHGAAVGVGESGDQFQQRGLAGAAGAVERHELPRGDRHRDAVHGADRLAFPHAVVLDEIPELEHRRCH